MALKKGYTAKLYRNSATYGTPTWVEIDNVRDVNFPHAYEKLEATTRASGGVKEYEPGELELSFSFKIRSDEADTDFTSLETAYLARSLIDLMILDGDKATNGSRGYRYEAKVFSMGEDQAIGNILFRDVEVGPCISANAKATVVVASGAPVFTTIAVA